MNTEKFFEAFTELDDDLIENALPKEQEYDVVKPALKIQSWKPWVAGAAVAAAAFGVVFAGVKLFGSGKVGTAPAFGLTESGVMPGGINDDSGAFDGPCFGAMIVDWVMYDSAEKLVNAGDIICTGKVTDISFALIDKSTGRELSENSDKRNAELNTVYEVEVKTPYRGVYESKIKFRALGGLKDYKTDEQLELLKDTGDDTILIMNEPPEIKLGEEYLFILNQYDENTMPCIINAPQTAFPLSDPSYRDSFSNASVNDILECLGVKCHVGEGNPYAELSITHDGQIISLAEIDHDKLTAAVWDALTTDCLPELQLNTVITDQDIEKYGKNGYAIDLVFNDIDAPLPDGASDKKAQVFWHATVLIGAENESSYISYSYTYISLDGSSEYKSGGTYFLGEKSREALLALIDAAEKSQNDGVYAPEMLFDYYNDPDNLPKQYANDFTLPEFPGVVFSWTNQNIVARHDNDKWELYMGSPVWGVYLYDLNGDGKREICSTVGYGSGIVDDRIYAYDYANGKLYELEARGVCNYSLGFKDGDLMYIQENSAGEKIAKRLKIGDMCEVADPQSRCHGVNPTTTTTTGTHHSEHDETHH